MKIYPILLLISFCFPVCSLYGKFQCPTTPERRLRAKWYCQKYGQKEEKYACLYDAILNGYQEKCTFKANILDPGEKYIINHRPTSAKCDNANRYQPFGLQHFSDQCVYQRSMCSELGQIRFNDGSEIVDKSCRCNVAQGYAFVTSPVRRCYCTPSTEDCTCFLKRCPDNFTLSSDYQCIHMNNKSYQASCPGVDNQQSSNQDTTYKGDFQENTFEDPKYQRDAPAVFILACTFIMVVISCLLQHDKMPYFCYIEIPQPSDLKAVPENGCLTLTWSFPVQNQIKVESYKIVYTCTSDDWTHANWISVDANELYCVIPNVIPMKTYRFKVSACVKDHNGKLSDEHCFNSGSPIPPSQLTISTYNRVLTLTWTSPKQELFKIRYYKIRYTYSDKTSLIKVDANIFSRNIPNILPLQTYRFQISSCLEDFDGQPSEEHMFNSGSPSPPTQLETFIENRALILTWTSPIQGLFDVKYYQILYTSTKEKSPTQIKVDANTLSSTIPNIRPMQTYRFKISSCLDDFVGQPSEEHIFHSDTPSPPTQLETFIENRVLILTWTSPIQGLFDVKYYQILYTSTKEKSPTLIKIDAKTLSSNIPNIRPMQTYRFKISSCLDDFVGQPSEEHIFYSDKPEQSSKLDHFIGTTRSIRLVWIAPAEVLFKTESYELEVTIDSWKTWRTFQIPASELEYEIPDFTVDATYRFRLYTVCHSVKSFPREDYCVASPRYHVEIHLNGTIHQDALQDETSPLFMSLREGIEHGVKETLSDFGGDNDIEALKFRPGSLYAVFIFISKTCNYEAKLRNAFVKKIKTGKFGKFSVSMEGFIFQALDNPVPPQIVRAELANTVINIFWEKPVEIFFPTVHYLLQSTTDDWKTVKEIPISADQDQYCVSNVFKSQKYKFKMLTIAQNDVKSIPSNEVHIVTEGSIPLPDVKAIHQGCNVVMRTTFRSVTNIGNQSTLKVEGSFCEFINRVPDLIFSQGSKRPNDSDATSESLSVALWKSTPYQFMKKEKLEIIRNSTSDLETRLLFVKAQAAIRKKCPRVDDDSTWLYYVLEDIGANDLYRKTCKRAGIITEILVSFDNWMTCYNIGSGIEGTNTLGELINLEVIQCDETITVIDDLAKADQNQMFLLTIATSDNHIGYVKLQLVLRGIPCTSKHLPVNESVEKTVVKTDKFDRVVIIDSPHVKAKPTQNCDISKDTVKAYRCLTWPKMANEWLSRNRVHKWPTEDTIREFEILGCFVVKEGHPFSSETELEWKVSFCLQERILMYNLTDVQHKCYVLLKMLNQEILHLDCITSYHWKTCLFYVIENNSVYIWTKDHLLYCLELCVKQMIEWLKRDFCPGFFIPGANLFDGKLNDEKRLTSEKILIDLLKVGFGFLLYVNNAPICYFVRLRGSRRLFQKFQVNCRIANQEALIIMNTSIINSVLRVFNHRILEHYFFLSDKHNVCFIQYLWQMIDHIENVGIMKGHTIEETKRSLSLLKPHVYTCLASNIAAMAIQHHNYEVRDFLLIESFSYFIKGYFPGLLKFISVLYAVGLYEECEWYIDQQDEKYITNSASLCNCRLNKNDFNVTMNNIINNSELIVSTCVIFLPTELSITPDALKYEMFRHFGTPFSPKNEKIFFRWQSRSVIDSNIYYFLLKYLVKNKLRKIEESDNAVCRIIQVMREKNVRHRDAVFNLLAWLFFAEGNTPVALECLKSSWRVMTNWDFRNWKFPELVELMENQFNSAKLHALVILYNTWFGRRSKDPTFCFHCLGISLVQKCPKCKIAAYCSKQCRIENWKIHRAICEMLSSIS